MRAPRSIPILALVVLATAGSLKAQNFPGSRERSPSGFALGLNGGYSLLGGAVGDSTSGGFRLGGSAIYDFEDVPLQAGIGGSYSWFSFDVPSGSPGADSYDGSLEKFSVFGLGTWKFLDIESSMVPYVTARVGWTRLSDDVGCQQPLCGREVIGTRTRSGFEIGAEIGVQIPVSRSVAIDIGGSFDWLSAGDYRIEGTWADDGTGVSDTLDDTGESGTAFSLFAGALFFLSP
jgi:opacity protein-like surface antigen